MTAASGVAELSAAQAGARATRQLAGAGVVMATQGAEEVGAAEGLEAGAAIAQANELEAGGQGAGQAVDEGAAGRSRPAKGRSASGSTRKK